jgi:hypothetical protein
MKKVFLNIAFLLVGLVSFSQIQTSKSINPENLVGMWKPQVPSSNLLFYKDTNNKLTVKEFENADLEDFEIIEFKVYKTYFTVKSRFIETNWVSDSKYTLINNTTLKCSVKTSDGVSTIFYNKILTNKK